VALRLARCVALVVATLVAGALVVVTLVVAALAVTLVVAALAVTLVVAALAVARRFVARRCRRVTELREQALALDPAEVGQRGLRVRRTQRQDAQSLHGRDLPGRAGRQRAPARALGECRAAPERKRSGGDD